jgi:hypothetical protein
LRNGPYGRWKPVSPPLPDLRDAAEPCAFARPRTVAPSPRATRHHAAGSPCCAAPPV